MNEAIDLLELAVVLVNFGEKLSDHILIRDLSVCLYVLDYPFLGLRCHDCYGVLKLVKDGPLVFFIFGRQSGRRLLVEKTKQCSR